VAPGYVFCAPKNGPDEAGPGQDGCLILDNTGQPVWFRPVAREAMDVMDFKLQRYGGEPVLTWWEGEHTGYGQGEYVLMDASYREVARVRAGNGLQGDHHEFIISPEDTALFDIYHRVPMDLSDMGGEADSTVLDGIVQEVDIETGEVLFEWHSLDHVGIDETYAKPTKSPRPSLDYFHINSIDVDRVFAATQGNVQVLENANVFVGWGSAPVMSEFDRGGGLLFSAAFPAESESYRAFRFEWEGRPQDKPIVAAEVGPDEKVTLYASWNGATEVADWEVLAGPAVDRLEPVASAPRKGFEVAITGGDAGSLRRRARKGSLRQGARCLQAHQTQSLGDAPRWRRPFLRSSEWCVNRFLGTSPVRNSRKFVPLEYAQRIQRYI
jgi:hypothetical protein